MTKRKYISFILFLIVLVTMINLYYKPHFIEHGKPINWLEKMIHPINRSNCSLQGFKCPSDKPCDCEKYCTNEKEFESFQVLDDDSRIYVMNQRLSPGTYCLPKGVGECNLKTSYHIFSLAGWSCLPLNDVVFKRDKKQACKNDEAQDNSLNVLWDYLKDEEAADDVEDYYEPLGSDLRYRCKCKSKALDGTPMITVFPFVCSVDYCLRDIPNPLPLMGWNGKGCECGPYFHLKSDDETSPCRTQISRIEGNIYTGRVECMTMQSFVKHPLICPADNSNIIFQEKAFRGKDSTEYVQMLLDNKYI